jgi:hypothetical protein
MAIRLSANKQGAESGMTQSTRNMATAIFCLVALVPVVAASPAARSPISGTRTAVNLLASEAQRTVKKLAHAHYSHDLVRGNCAPIGTRVVDLDAGVRHKNVPNLGFSADHITYPFSAISLLDSSSKWYRLAS